MHDFLEVGIGKQTLPHLKGIETPGPIILLRPARHERVWAVPP